MVSYKIFVKIENGREGIYDKYEMIEGFINHETKRFWRPESFQWKIRDGSRHRVNNNS